jgi:hypothetical protein
VLSIHTIAVTRVVLAQVSGYVAVSQMTAGQPADKGHDEHRADPMSEKRGDGYRDDDACRQCLRVPSLPDVHGFSSVSRSPRWCGIRRWQC